MRFQVVTLFPELLSSFLSASLLGKAIDGGLVEVSFINPRDFATDKHRTVDDAPFGGGSGMVLKPEPWVAAIEGADPPDCKAHRVLMTPQGQPLHQRSLQRLSEMDCVTLICGRYEGFDERILSVVDEELSLGDFVLNGGEVAAMAIIDGVSRLLPGVLGNPESLETESHGANLLEYPQYTRPRVFREQEVPQVLLGGDHGAIARWRDEQMAQRTAERRPDLWAVVSKERTGAPSAPTPQAQVESVAADRRAAVANRCYVALMHHPVYDKVGEVVTTALTNLDLHDIARSSRSFALSGYFIVTPLSSQRELADRILSHWRDGHGARVHDKRRQALERVTVVPDLDKLLAVVEEREGAMPLLVASSARSGSDRIAPDALVDTLWEQQRPGVLLLGTGWGLTKEIMELAELTLGPIQGATDYNHLSVRSAAAILLDRCFGMRE